MKTTIPAFLVALGLAAVHPGDCRAVGSPATFASKCPGQYDCNGNGTECAKSKDCCTRNVAKAAAKCAEMGCSCDSCSGANTCKGKSLDRLRDALNGGDGPSTDWPADADKLAAGDGQDHDKLSTCNDGRKSNPNGDLSHQNGTASGLSSDVPGVVIDNTCNPDGT